MQVGGCKQQSAYYACCARIRCAQHIINYCRGCQGRNYAAPCDLWIENSTCGRSGERAVALTVALTTQGPRRVLLCAHKVTEHCFLILPVCILALVTAARLFASISGNKLSLTSGSPVAAHQALTQNCLAADVNLIRAKQSKSKSIAVWHMKFILHLRCGRLIHKQSKKGLPYN